MNFYWHLKVVRLCVALFMYVWSSCSSIYNSTIIMICQFPTEILELVLLELPILDLITTVKSNRRLYEIVHSRKSPVRHRLVKRILALELQIKNGTNYIKECNCSNVNFQIFCTILTYKRLVKSIDFPTLFLKPYRASHKL